MNGCFTIRGWVFGSLVGLHVLLLIAGTALAAGFADLCADRTATERVYYNHRLETKQAFEQVMPPALVEKLVHKELQKEAALKKAWNVEVTSSQVTAEVERINTTTRAPEVLKELKAALGNDAERFARTVARPLVVEGELRKRFENDDSLHLAQRQAMEKLRATLLLARTNGAGTDKLIELLRTQKEGQFAISSWQLGKRPESPAELAEPTELQLKAQREFGPKAQILSSPAAEKEHKLWFEDIQPDLQNVLRAQLRDAGDVSAVIEAPTGFLLYVAKGKSSTELSAAVLSLAKRSYDEWIEEQSNSK
ncbi:MAG: Kelch motif protein [Verrucomicrobiales bacterium]|nr:Kelch motif protein [Verrucomicrobiales bacterium]